MTAAKKTFAELKVGDTAAHEQKITAEDVVSFAKISGDMNPLHADEKYAATTQFKQVVVHGMYLGSLVSQLVGMKLPGAYSLLMKVSLEFKKPVFVGDTVTVKGSIVHKSDAARLVEISVAIERSGEVAVSGSAHVRLLQ